jgi:hypothetical protein
MAAVEQKKSYLVTKQFKGINSKSNRTAIEETEFSWLENIMPLGYGNLKALNAPDSQSVSFGNTVTQLFSVNINNKDYALAFQADGRCEYVDLATNTKGNVAVTSTFSNSGMRVSQWKSERALILDPAKGYYTWNGTNLVFVGSVGFVGLVSGGAGYTEAPAVIISAPNDANGVQATAVCTITEGSGGVKFISMTNVGSGYTSVPDVAIGAPNLPGGTQATAVATTLSNTVVLITVTNSGSGYTTAPSVTITGGGGASATANSTIATGTINAVILTEAGSGYTSPPTVTFTGGGGSGANAVASLVTFQKGTVSVLITGGGVGYTNASNLSVTISGGGGANAAATGIISGGQVVQAVMTNPGSGYTNASNITVTITGGGGSNATAKAIINLDDNTGVQSFSGRVWIAAGRNVYYTAAGSYSDFTSVSAGTVSLTDATLRSNIVNLLSANNFLYIFGEDSINVFSDVRVTTAGTTLFTNTNVSASVGTKLPYAIFPYFRSVLFMNDYGVYALVGSTTSKLSDALDTVVENIDYSFDITSGQVLLNNTLCAAFNVRYTGDSTSGRFIQMIFFEKKWFVSSQGAIKHITALPIDGQGLIYGTTGTDLYKLYSNVSATIATTAATALHAMGDPIRDKQALKVGIEATASNAYPFIFNMTVDNENRSSPAYTLSSFVTWVNNSNSTISWLNNSSNIVQWGTVGYNLYKTDAQQYGKYLGMTVTSTSPGFTINGFEYEHELRARF